MAIGSLVTVPSLGRIASVLGTTAIGAPQDGRQTVSVRYQARVPAETAGAEGVAAPPTASAAIVRTVAPAGSCSDCDGEDKRRGDRLTAEERAALDRLLRREFQVKQEEKAHAAAAGAAAGPIRYAYRTGPDGRQYADSGKVAAGFSDPGGDPAAMQDIANRVATAANAAASPSAADLAAARQGYRTAAAAGDAAGRRMLDIVG